MGRGTERAGSRAALVLSALAAGIGTIGTTARAGTCTEQQQELLAPDPGSGDQLGFAVALSDDTAVVGAYLHDDGATNAG